ncbi:hypothetical protein CANMA_002965 [Candida margitis]|uniref:uncharacterized protein n=1 Tax=Candida margitis TaxID=1775924 RepID=UPI0022266F91|nr:uncharacterized protein CANMA_002965 [Candida margitis]KAI5967531.1 hypothetical protein CANMA_002965 [Candida margitis]
MAPSIPPSSPTSTIGSTKKNNLLNRFIKRKGGGRNSVSGADNDSNAKTSRSGSIRSNNNTSRSRSKGDKLQKISTRGSSRSRKRDLSEGRDFYVDNDDDSYLYRDEDDDGMDEEGDTNTLGYDSDTSSNVSLGRSPSILSKVKSNHKRSSTILNHNVDDKVAFPNLDQIIHDSNLTLSIANEDDAPWNGLTYESFLIPKYVRTSRHTKQSPKIINNLFLAQELNVDNYKANNSSLKSNESSDAEQDHTYSNPVSEDEDAAPNFESSNGIGKEIFVMKFSRDGKYLAAAGRDSVIRVWKVISSPLGRLEFNQSERNTTPIRSNKRDAVFDSAPVFHKTPIELRGHTSGIISLAWSKNNFLISGSMDKTAKLWHVDRPNCLQTFQHQDFVTTVEFHPLDDRFFLSGSLDNEVRLWSILEKSVSYWRNLGEEVLVTALAFTPDGVSCVVGGFNGSIFFLETKGLHILHRAEIKERSIVNAFHDKSGNKVTGIEVFLNPTYDATYSPADISMDKWTVLITTNDSRIRMVSTLKKKLITRFKGLTNSSSSIAASVNENHKFIISGSEDHFCYVWENNNRIINNKIRQSLKEFVIDGKEHMNQFHHKHEKYTKLFHSNKLIGKLLDNGDDESLRYDFVANENNSYASFHAHHSRCNVAIFAPESTKTLLSLSDDLIFDLKKRGEACKMDPSICASVPGCADHSSKEGARFDEGPGEGDIIVTTDQYGLIRVFRQDIASSYRRQFIDLYKKCQAQNKSSAMLSPESNSIKSGGGSISYGSGVGGNGSIGHNFRPSRKLSGGERHSISRNLESSRSIGSILSSKRGSSSTDVSNPSFSTNDQYRPAPIPTPDSYASTTTSSSNYTYQQRHLPSSHQNNGMFHQPDIHIHSDEDDDKLGEDGDEFDPLESDATSTTETDHVIPSSIYARRKQQHSSSSLATLEHKNGSTEAHYQEMFPSLKKTVNQSHNARVPAPPVTPPAGNQMHHVAHYPHPQPQNPGYSMQFGTNNVIPRGPITASSAQAAATAATSSTSTPIPTSIQSSDTYPVYPQPVSMRTASTKVPQIVEPERSPSPSPSPSPLPLPPGQQNQQHQHQLHHQLQPDLHSQISSESIRS